VEGGKGKDELHPTLFRPCFHSTAILVSV